MSKSSLLAQLSLRSLVLTSIVLLGHPQQVSAQAAAQAAAQAHVFQPMVLTDKYPRQDSDQSWISRIHLHDVDDDGAPDMISVKESTSREGNRQLSFAWTPNDYDKVPFAERVDFGPNRVVYREESDLILGNYPAGMQSVIVDLNGDLLTDIVALYPDPNSDSVALSAHFNTGRASPRFASAQLLLTLPLSSTAVKFADMDGDGDLDVVGQSDSNDRRQLAVFLNNGNSTRFGPMSAPYMIGRADALSESSFTIGDVNNDGYNDVVQSRKKQDVIFLNSGTSRPFSASTQPRAVYHDNLPSSILRLADLDNDNDLDLVSIKGTIGQSRYFLNQGNDSLFRATPAHVFGYPGARLCTLSIADFNNDGLRDLLSGSCAGRQAPVRLFVNSGGRLPFPRLTAGIQGPPLINTPQLHSADIDNDGDIDFMTVTDGRNMYLNNGYRQSPMPVVTVSADNTVMEDIGSVYVNLELETALPYPVSMEFGTRPDSAINGEDFYGVFERLEFQPGETQKSVRIYILEDEIAENEESFKAIFSFVSGANINRNSLDIRIAEENTGIPAINIRSARARESSGEMVFRLRLSHASNSPVSLEIATRALPGGAIPGLDYSGKSEQITFAPGELEKTFSVQVLRDSEAEGVEVFGIKLFNLHNAVLANPDAVIRGVIIDQRSVAINYAKSDYENIIEGQSIRVAVVLDRPHTETVSVRIISRAIGTASAGDDYDEIDSVLRFKPGQTRRTLTVSTVDDRKKERTESFRLYMVNASEGVRTPRQIWKTIRILDND